MNKKYVYIIASAITIIQTVLAGPPPPPSGIKSTTTPSQQTTQPSQSKEQTNISETNFVTTFLNATTDQQIMALQGRFTSIGGAPQKIKPSTKYQPPQVATALSKASLASFTQIYNEAKTTGQLFNDPTIATAYIDFINAMQQVPSFIPLFRKIHIVALHQMYLNLIGIYATLNMTYLSDLKTYMVLEKKYGLNKKTLIINHLVNVIQAQLSQALQVLFPGIPETHAIKGGMTAIQHDHMSNPDMLILDLEQSVLAVLKVAPLSDTQAGQIVADLQKAENVALIEKNTAINKSDLAAGINIINTKGGSFVQTLIENKTAAQAIIEALDTIVGFYTQSQTSATYNAIIAQLSTGTGNALTTQQFGVFTKIVQQLAYGIPLSQEIAYANTFKKMLQNKDTTPLTADQIATLQGIVAFILQNYEQNSASMLSAIINHLGELNPEAQTLSPSQKIKLQILASQLLLPITQHPLELGAVEDDDRFLLSFGLHVLASTSNPNLSQQEQTILEALSHNLSQGPLSWEELTSDQTTGLKKALSLFAGYTFSPLASDNMEKQFTTDEQTELAALATQITGSDFTNFSIFTKEQQLLLLKMYQNLNVVIETRLETHKQQSTILQNVFGNDPNLKKELFSSITSDQYLALSTIDQQLKTSPTSFSFSSLSTVIEPTDSNTTGTSPYDALLQMFTPATDNPNSVPTTYISILTLLQTQHFTDPALLTLIENMNNSEHALYKSIVPLANTNGFTFDKLNTDQKTLLVKDFQQLATNTANQPITKNEGQAFLENPDEDLLETVADVIRYTLQFSETKTSFLWALKKYLRFFNVYTATLQEYQDKNYTGLTTFSTYAQSVIEQLKNTPLETLNPPVFFYNADTMRGIKLLPQLAKLVENTTLVPYPTFPMTLALEGSTIDPLDGKTYTNQVTLGSGQGAFSYNKFFFIDTNQTQDPTLITDANGNPQAYQPAKELTGQEAKAITWITKQTVPTSGQPTSYVVADSNGQEQTVTIKPYDYIYLPTTIPSGLSGFYMNIPVFSQNPLNKNQALVRLFEQPIYAQPEWLNKPGFSNTAPDGIPGIITMLRACLGDFQSGLSLHIFDPCLSMIFKAALAIPDSQIGSTTTIEQQQTNDPEIQTLSEQCSAYIDAKQAEVERMNEIHTINTDTSTILPGGTIDIPGGAQ